MVSSIRQPISNEFLVFKGLSFHDTLERVYEDMRVITIIVTPFKFFYIAVHVPNAIKIVKYRLFCL